MQTEITSERRATRQELILASCLGTAVVILVQYLGIEKPSMLMVGSATFLAYAAPLLAWSFIELYNQGALTPRRLIFARIGLLIFLIGFWLALLTIGWLPASSLVLAVAVVFADHLISERRTDSEEEAARRPG